MHKLMYVQKFLLKSFKDSSLTCKEQGERSERTRILNLIFFLFEGKYVNLCWKKGMNVFFIK